MRRSYLVALGIAHFLTIICLESGLQGQQGNQSPQNVTIQQPVLGVSVDANGVLTTNLFLDPTGRLAAEKLLVASRNLPESMQQPSTMRKVSLRKLSEHIAQEISAGRDLDGAASHLAVLTKIEYVFVLPKQNDIVIAGPAGPWAENLAGQAVSLVSGRPVLLLDDLLAAIRLFPPTNNNRAKQPWIACSIDPTADGLRRFQELQRAIPNRIHDSQRAAVTAKLLSELQTALGMANVNVYGVSPQSHMAHVMIAGDYHMKLIGIGLEAPPTKMITFIDAIQGSLSGMQRWWLVPEYQCLIESPDRSILNVINAGVKLLTEDYAQSPQGGLVNTGQKPSRASRQYAESFTEQFDEIAANNAAFAQLRAVMDWLIVCAWLQKSSAFEQAGWDGGLLFDAARLPIAQLLEATQAPCVANAVWKDRLLVAPVGGGVSISPNESLKPEVLRVDTALPEAATTKLNIGARDNNWWWD